jgi:hypothetical protein
VVTTSTTNFCASSSNPNFDTSDCDNNAVFLTGPTLISSGTCLNNGDC